MMDALLNLTAQMAREGIRRLLVLSGDESWTLQQAQALRERLGGDGLWVGPEPVSAPCVAPGALKTLLGREVMHAFFDARRGFDVAAMAAQYGLPDDHGGQTDDDHGVGVHVAVGAVAVLGLAQARDRLINKALHRRTVCIRSQSRQGRAGGVGVGVGLAGPLGNEQAVRAEAARQ